MRKALFFTLVFCMSAIAAAAQNADLSGKWTLDAAKSELGPVAANIKSQTLTITHAGTSFKVVTDTQRNPPPEGTGGRGSAEGRPAPGGPMGPLEQAFTLNGQEISEERPGREGPVTIKTRSEQSGNKVVVTRIFPPAPDGRELKAVDTYELAADGKTLTVVRESPRGTTKSVYVKS